MISKYKWHLIIGIILAAAVIYYLNRSVSAVNHTVKNFNEAYFASLPQKEGDTINQCSIPGYIDKLRKKAYLKSQVKMAASDSVGMIINMRDSVIMLQIKGVNRQKELRSDNALSVLSFREQIRKQFSVCFQIH